LNGRESLKDEGTYGKANFNSKTRNDRKSDFVTNACNASLKMMEKTLNINRKTIRTIFHEDLSKTKVCAKFVPHTLTDKQKLMRVDVPKMSLQPPEMIQTF